MSVHMSHKDEGAGQGIDGNKIAIQNRFKHILISQPQRY
jgi:hypothetical protein